ncbi:MAG TPA: citrate transporter, partial [Marine Group III euryarchaeote]|nr:citrate transporter [Marine Group III euryarchaeote]
MTPDAILVLLIFIISFVLILGEYVHRTLAAWGGALLMLAVGKIYGTLDWCSGHGSQDCNNNLFTAIDFNVIGLLMGMMVFAAMLEISGFFEFVAVKATKLSKGDPWMLIVYLGTFTTLISVVIDNVTAIILIAPITIKICDKIKISAIPPLIAEAILSDTGGVATLVGDPPNVMIASATGFTFNSFIEHLAPLTIFAWVATLGYMRYYYRDWMKTKPKHVEDVLAENEWDVIRDRTMMNRTLMALAGTIVLFSLHELLHLDLEISAIALGGAGLAMMLCLPEINEVIERIEWPALIFFGGLFVMVGGLEHMGHLEAIAFWIFDNFADDPVMLAVMVIWVSAFSSAIVDNIPFCAAMIPVIYKLGELSEDINTAPLFWALAMGCGFGGNATPIGSSANVMTVSISERGGHKITTAEWMRVGLPVMLITCVVATIFMYLF